MNADSIKVNISEDSAFVQVEGKGSFLNSHGLKMFASSMVDKGVREFFIDLGHCPAMDSTFMGTLTFIAGRLRSRLNGVLHIVNASPRNVDSLCNLGLNELLSIRSDYVPAGMGAGESAGLESFMVDYQPPSQVEHCEVMIAAHEEIIAFRPENAAKFKDVLEYLKEDLQKAKAE